MEMKQHVDSSQKQINENLDDQSHNNSHRVMLETIESLIFQPKQNCKYTINDEGATNRRRLFSSSEEQNFFSQAKSVSQDIYPYEGTERQAELGEGNLDLTFRSVQNCQGNLTQSINEKIVDDLFQNKVESLNTSLQKHSKEQQNSPLNLQQSNKFNFQLQDQQSMQNTSSDFSQMLQTGSKQKKLHESNLINYKYSKHINNSYKIQSTLYNIEMDDNSKLQNYKQKQNRNDSMYHSIIVKDSRENTVVEGVNKDNNLHAQHKNYLVSLTYLKKFVKQLLLRVAYQDYRILQKKHLQILNDQSIIDLSHFEKMHGFGKDENLDIIHRRNNILLHKNGRKHSIVIEAKQKLFNFLYNTFYIFWSRSKALQPSSLVIIIWEIFFLFLLVGQLILIPIKGCFDQINLEADFWLYILYKIPIMCFVIDIIIGFHTGYFEYGKPIMDKKRIAINYIYRKFWIDFCCTILISFNLTIRSDIVDFIAMFLRINQIKIKVGKIDQRFRLSYKYSLLTQILSLIVLMVFLAHLTGCGFHLVGEYTDKLLPASTPSKGVQIIYRSWIHAQGLDDKDWITRYISSIYFSIISMITIGYGDIAPINTYEKIYVIGMTFVSCGTFAYCINTIGNIFAQRGQKQKDFEQNQYQLQAYLDFMQTPQDTQIRVLKYFEYLNEQSDEAIIKGAQIFDECSSDLKEEIVCDRNMKLLLTIPIFRKNFSNEFLKDIALKMQEKRYGPGETILSENQIPQYLTILTKGDVEHYYQSKQNKQPLKVNQSKVLVLKQFLTEDPVQLPLRAKNVVTTIQLPYNKFTESLKNFQMDYVNQFNQLKRTPFLQQQLIGVLKMPFLFEKFCMIRDQMIFDNRHIEVCYSCQQYGHELQACPQIHFQLQSIQFAKKVFYSGTQVNRVYNPRRKKYTNTLSNQIHVALSLKMKRWEIISQLYPDYYDTDVKQELNIQEKDKYFYKRCPKINLSKYQSQFQQNSLRTNMKETNQITTLNQIQVDGLKNSQFINNYNNDDISKNVSLQDSSSNSDDSMSQTDSSSSSSEEENSNSNYNTSNFNNSNNNNSQLNNLNTVNTNNSNGNKQQTSLNEIQQSVQASEKKRKQTSSNMFESDQGGNKQEEQIQLLHHLNQLQQASNNQPNNSKNSFLQTNKKSLKHGQEFPFMSLEQKSNSQNNQNTNQNQQKTDQQQFFIQEGDIFGISQQLQLFGSLLEPSRSSELIQKKMINENEKKQLIHGSEYLNNSNDEVHPFDVNHLHTLKKMIDYLCQQKNPTSIQTAVPQTQEDKHLEELRLKKKSTSNNYNQTRRQSKQNNQIFENQMVQHNRRTSQRVNQIERLFNHTQQQQKQSNSQFMAVPKVQERSLNSLNENKTQYSQIKALSKEQESFNPKNPDDQENNNQFQANYLLDHKQINENYFFGQIGLKFEKVKEYTIYYPKNNISNVIKSYKKVLQKQNISIKASKHIQVDKKILNYKAKYTQLRPNHKLKQGSYE